MLIDISGKTVIITGAGRGIGAGLARRFASEGTRLVLVERDANGLDAIVREITSIGSSVEGIVGDVSLPEDAARIAREAASAFGSIDVLVNNAGIAPSGTVEDMSAAMWDETYAINVRGVFLMSQAVIPQMKRQRWGRILNASSFAAIIPSYGFSAYASAKAAVTSLTRVLAAELGPWGVTANSYAPGMVPTTMNGFAEATPERQQALLNTLTIRRWETPDDVASLLIFLSSDHAAYLTGTMFDASGGKFAVQFPEAAYRAAGNP